MECEAVLFRLWEYLDEELGPKEAEAVRAHLRQCRECYPAFCCHRAFLELLARQCNRCAPRRVLTSIRMRLGAS